MFLILTKILLWYTTLNTTYNRLWMWWLIILVLLKHSVIKIHLAIFLLLENVILFITLVSLVPVEEVKVVFFFFFLCLRKRSKFVETDCKEFWPFVTLMTICDSWPLMLEPVGHTCMKWVSVYSGDCDCFLSEANPARVGREAEKRERGRGKTKERRRRESRTSGDRARLVEISYPGICCIL